MQHNELKPRRKLAIKLALLVFLVLTGWIVYDLFGPRTARLREFNADEVASLETAMWRSYYDKKRVSLFMQLASLMRAQYNMPLFRSNLVAYHGAKAAFVFKEGKERADYEKALPNLVKFYTAIREMSDLPFDVDRASRLELEWWIIHRERAKHHPGDLEEALAVLQAELYKLPIDHLREHGRLRAEAMLIRDTKAEQSRVTESDWAKIDELLHQSWRSLSKAVKV